MARGLNYGAPITDKIVGVSTTPINFNYNSPFSTVGWFQPNTPWNGEVHLFGHINMGASGFPGWEIHSIDSLFDFFLISNWPTLALYKKANTTISTSSATWRHYGATYSGSTTAAGLNLYTNGSLDNGAVMNDTLGNNSTQSSLPPRIGSRSDGSIPMHGNAADCAVWNVELTAGEIASLYKGRRPWMVRPGSLVLYWPLDGIESPEPDLSGNANNGTLTGTGFVPGPPVTMFMPRWPRNYDPTAVANIPLSQTHFRFRTDTGAVDATPTWGDAEDAA